MRQRWLVGLALGTLAAVAMPAGSAAGTGQKQQQQQRWLVRAAEALRAGRAKPLFDAVRFEQRGLRLVHEYERIPWAAVEGPESALHEMVRAGLVERFELDAPRYLARSGAASVQPPRAALPWPLVLAGLLLAACGDDEEEDDGDRPPQLAGWGIAKVRADQAHRQSRGRGVRVAVIDTGIDAEHPDLRVEAGRNFVEASLPPGASEPWDDCNGHGTHVAGIVAALDNDFGAVGVAPEAELYAARVFDCTAEGAATSDIIEAIEWSVAQRVHVINMSLGGDFPSQAEAEAARAAEAAGVLLVAASGNDSEPGVPAPVSYPAAFDSVVAVGATDELDGLASFSNQGPEVELSAPGVGIYSTYPVGTALRAQLEQRSRSMPAIPMEFSGIGEIGGELHFCGLALAGSDCPASVSGEVALIERGQNFFSEKVQNAMSAGARAAIIYNHTQDGGGLYTGTLGETGNWIPTVAVSNADGLALRAAGDGASVQVEVRDKSDYFYESGTSMATPHVAGVAALLLAQRPGLRPAELRALLQGGATDLGSAGRDVRFGFGRVDALASLSRLAGTFSALFSGPAYPVAKGVGPGRLAR